MSLCTIPGTNRASMASLMFKSSAISFPSSRQASILLLRRGIPPLMFLSPQLLTGSPQLPNPSLGLNPRVMKPSGLSSLPQGAPVLQPVHVGCSPQVRTVWKGQAEQLIELQQLVLRISAGQLVLMDVGTVHEGLTVSATEEHTLHHSKNGICKHMDSSYGYGGLRLTVTLRSAGVSMAVS